MKGRDSMVRLGAGQRLESEVEGRVQSREVKLQGGGGLRDGRCSGC